MSNVIALVAHMNPDQRAAVRSRVSAVVEKLTTVLDEMIAALDQLDGDADLEPTMGEVAAGHVDEAEPPEDTEPSLGWTSTFNQASSNRGMGGCDDLEDDDADREPSLGALESHPSPFLGNTDGGQTRWGSSGTHDLEEQCEGCGGDDHVRVNPTDSQDVRVIAEHHARDGC